MKKRTVALLLALVLCAGCAVGGTVAWLTAQTGSVTNTFVVGDIGVLALVENGEAITTATTKDFKIIPGVAIKKDVEVSYSYTDNDSDDYEAVPVYVFVKIATPDNSWTVSGKSYTAASGKLSWSVADGWTALDSVPGVYYREVAANVALDKVDVITGGTITVANTITKGDIATVSAAAGDITITAYAIQQATFDTNVAGAWAAIPGNA